MHNFGLVVVWLIAGILLMSMLSEWFYSKAILFPEWSEAPPFKFWCLLRRVDDRGRFNGYVFLLKLPSYAWELDACNNRFCWMRRVMVHDRDGWSVHAFPEM